MRTKTVNAKRLVVLAAVVIICAACLVSAAYAYNATYKDTVSQQGLTPDETAKYIYVNSSETGLELPTLTLNVVGQYDSTTDMTADEGKTVLSNGKYSISGLSGENNTAVLKDDTAYIKIGTVSVVSKNLDVSDVETAYLSVKEIDTASVASGSTNILAASDGKVQTSDVKFVLTNADNTVDKVAEGSSYITSVSFTEADKDIDVDVYLVVKIKTDSSDFEHKNLTLDESGNISNATGDDASNKLSTGLVIPKITVTLTASDKDPAAATP